MKRRWAIWLIAAVAMGCRSSQPTTNPFLRTTVPPPGTGQGAVVVPGEPYYPGATPPPATVTPEAAGTPVLPVTPPPAAGPVGAPSPVPLRNNKYSPPGGSYIYNQSSIGFPKPGLRADTTDDGSSLAARTSGRERDDKEQTTLEELRLPSVANAVDQAKRWSAEPDAVELAHADGADSSRSVAAAVAATNPAEHNPLPLPAAPAVDGSPDDSAVLAPSSTQRIGPASTRSDTSAPEATTVMRISVGGPARSAGDHSELAAQESDAPTMPSEPSDDAMGDQLVAGWRENQRGTRTFGPSAGAGRSNTWRASASRPSTSSAL